MGADDGAIVRTGKERPTSSLRKAPTARRAHSPGGRNLATGRSNTFSADRASGIFSGAAQARFLRVRGGGRRRLGSVNPGGKEGAQSLARNPTTLLEEEGMSSLPWHATVRSHEYKKDAGHASNAERGSCP